MYRQKAKRVDKKQKQKAKQKAKSKSKAKSKNKKQKQKQKQKQKAKTKAKTKSKTYRQKAKIKSKNNLTVASEPIQFGEASAQICEPVTYLISNFPGRCCTSYSYCTSTRNQSRIF
jgi:hypothetical protein